MAKNLTYPNATYFTNGVQTDELYLINAATQPTDTSSYGIHRIGTDLYWWNGTASTQLTSTGSDPGVPGSLDSAYSIGRDVSVDEGASTWTDASAGALNTFELVKSGAGSGNVLDLTVSAALTGNVIDIALGAAATGVALAMDMNLGIAATGIFIDNGGTARTGADILVTADGSGNHSVLDINDSGTGDTVGVDIAAAGSGAVTGLKYVGSYNGAPAGHAIYIDLNDGDGTDTQCVYMIAGTGTRNTNMVEMVLEGTGSGNMFDLSMDGNGTGDCISIDMNAALDGKAIYIDDGTKTRTDDLIVIASSGGGNVDVFTIVDANTGSGAIFDINMDGNGGGSVIDCDMNAAVDEEFILLDSGAGVRTANLFEIKHEGAGDKSVFNIADTSTGSGTIFTIAVTGVAADGAVMDVDMGASVARPFLILDYGDDTRTADMCEVTFDGDGDAPFWDINITNDGSGATAHYWDIDLGDAFDSNVLDIAIGAHAATGDMIKVAMGGTAVSASALVISAGGARTDDLIKIDDSSTGAGSRSVFDINCTGTGTYSVIDISQANAAVNINPILITRGSGTNAAAAIKVDDGGTTSHGIFDINITGKATTAAVFDITYSDVATNDAISLTMANNVGGSALVIDAAGTRTDDVIKLEITDAGSAMVIDANIDAAGSGNFLDVTYASDAHTGNAIDLNMGTNVAGMAISIATAATGTSGEGAALDVVHTGALAAGADILRVTSTGDHDATSNVLSLEQNTGACTAGANVLHIKAAGANCEAIEVEEGVVFLAPVTATPGSGNGETLPVTGNVIFYDPNGGSRTGVILTAGLRDGQHIKIVNIADAAENVTFAAKATSNVGPGTGVIIGQYEALEMVWNATTTTWYPLATVFS